MATDVTVAPTAAQPADRAPVTTRTSPSGPTWRGDRWLPTVSRVAVHCVVWTSVLVPIIIELSDGARPVRDDAEISINAYQVFSNNPPSVGPLSLASQGIHHTLFDLGPLLFWLLAVPVHLDPSRGSLWGAALLCGCALSVAAEAAWSVKAWPAALVVALVVADLGWQTLILDNLSWNAYFGLVFLVAGLATSWAVASGRFGWFPVAVFFLSVSAQCHLIYVVPAIAIGVATPLIGLIERHRPTRHRWWIASLIVGAVCWAPPVLQEIFGNPKNLSELIASRGLRRSAGLTFGFHTLATAALPHPIWLTQFPYFISFAGRMPAYLRSHSIVWAFVALFLLIAVAVVSGRTRPQLSALAAIAFILSIGVVFGFAEFPQDDLALSGYISAVLWLVGMIIWVVLLWAAIELAVAAWSRWQPHGLHPARTKTLGRGVQLAGLVLLVIAGIAGLHALVPASAAIARDGQTDRAIDDRIAAAVERRSPTGPVIVVVQPSTFSSPRLDADFDLYVIDYWGVAMPLLASGRQPRLYGTNGTAIHLSVPPGSRWPEVVAHVDPSTLAVTAVRRR
jgi:hypothetical protein